MNICILGPELQVGGAERLVTEEANYLRRHGHEVSIICPKINPNIESGAPIHEDVGIREYLDMHHSSAGFFTRLKEIANNIKKLSPDLVMSHYHDIEAYLIQRLGIEDYEYSCTIHGTPLWFANSPHVIPHLRNPEVQRIMQSVPGHREFHGDHDIPVLRQVRAEGGEYLRKLALKNSLVNFASSKQVQKELIALYDANSVVARAGVSEDWIDQNSGGKDSPFPKDDKVILSVSRLDERKRVELLIHCLELLQEDMSVKLAIVGDGPQFEELNQLAGRLDLKTHIDFKGFVPDDELPSYYNNADVFACPGWMSYGLTPLEAYSMNTPVVVSSDTFSHELLRGKPSVWIAEPTVEDFYEKILSSFQIDDPKFEAIPTWKEYFEHKFQVIRMNFDSLTAHNEE